MKLKLEDVSKYLMNLGFLKHPLVFVITGMFSIYMITMMILIPVIMIDDKDINDNLYNSNQVAGDYNPDLFNAIQSEAAAALIIVSIVGYVISGAVIVIGLLRRKRYYKI